MYYYNYITKINVTKKQNKKKYIERAIFIRRILSNYICLSRGKGRKGKVVPHFWVRFPYSPERFVA